MTWMHSLAGIISKVWVNIVTLVSIKRSEKNAKGVIETNKSEMHLTMVGVDPSCLGGISTLSSMLISVFSDMKSLDFAYVSTSNQGSAVSKISMFCRSLFILAHRLKCTHQGIVHIHMADNFSVFRAGVCMRLARLCNQKIIIHVHCDLVNVYSRASRVVRKNISDVLMNSDCIISLGSYLFELIDLLNIGRNKVFILPNAVKCPANNLYNSSSSHVLFLGNVSEGKGVLDLLDAIVLLKDHVPFSITFEICGRDMVGVQEEINRRKLDGLVSYLGVVKPDEVFFSRYMLNILPSHEEAMPISLLEASAFGIPSIVTSVGSIPEIIQDGINGVLVPARDVEKLSGAIYELLIDAEKRNSLSRNIHSTIYLKYSIDTYVSTLLKIYRSLTKKNNVRSGYGD